MAEILLARTGSPGASTARLGRAPRRDGAPRRTRGVDGRGQALVTNRLGQQLTAEFIGMFAFVFLGAGAAVIEQAIGGGLLPVALAHGFTMAIMISALGHISGGHFNPAVTVGAWVAGKIESLRATLYVVAQLAGAAAGAWVLSVTIPKSIWKTSSLGATLVGTGARSAGFTTEKDVLMEAVLTFFLVLVVFGTAFDERGTFRSIAGFGIGLIIAVDILVAGPITGASMNPGRSFGPALVSGNWKDFWIYIVGPLAGAVVAALVYWVAFLRTAEADADEAEPAYDEFPGPPPGALGGSSAED